MNSFDLMVACNLLQLCAFTWVYSMQANATKQIAQLTAQAPELGFVNSVAV